MSHSLPPSESLTVEFKSDRKRLPDAELVDVVVCLANAEGGEIWLGVEDDGTPECAPTLPHDRASRRAQLGREDASAQPVAGAVLADFDPLERERLRQAVQQYGGDRVLLELDDEALDGALGLTSRQLDGARATERWPMRQMSSSDCPLNQRIWISVGWWWRRKDGVATNCR